MVTQIIVFRLHFWSSSLETLLSNWVDETNDNLSFAILFKVTGKSSLDGVHDFCVQRNVLLITVAEDQVTSEFPFYTQQFPAREADGGWTSGGWAHGQCDYVLTWRRILSRTTPPDYVWFWEYDAQLRGGNMCDFLGRHDHMPHDLLASRYIQPYTTDPDWYWWTAPRKHLPVKEGDQWCGSFPVARFSRRYMNLLSKEIDKWSVFMEIAFPTFCLHHFGRECMTNICSDIVSPESFRTVPPELSPAEIRSAEQRGVLTLLHPVK